MIQKMRGKRVDHKEKRENSRRISASVSEEVYVRFWEYIKKKYVSPWRAFSRELEQAMIEYLDRHGEKNKKRKKERAE